MSDAVRQEVGKQVAVAVDNVLHHQDLVHDRDRLRLLLEVTESIASHRDLGELLQDLAQRLPSIVPFDYINVVLHEPTRNVMRLWLLVASVPSTISPGLEMPVEDIPRRMGLDASAAAHRQRSVAGTPLPQVDVHPA